MSGNQQTMLDFVQQRLAQSGGAQVPPNSMTDAPVYLAPPDTGDQTTPPVFSNQQLADQQRLAQKTSIEAQIKAVMADPTLPPAERDRQFAQLQSAWTQLDEVPFSQEAAFRRDQQREAVVPSLADTMMQAVQRRQQLERP